MAIRCSQCGHELPREDARFCSYCGHYNQQPQSQSQSAAPPAPRAAQDASAAQPPVRRPDANATPWLGIEGYPAPEVPRPPAAERNAPVAPSPSAPVEGQRPGVRKFNSSLEDGPASRPPVDGARSKSSPDQAAAAFNWSQPVTHVTSDASRQRQESRPASPPARSSSPGNFNVKVWDEQTISGSEGGAQQDADVARARQAATRDIDVEDMPTTNMKVEPSLNPGVNTVRVNPAASRPEAPHQQAQQSLSVYHPIPQTPASPPSTPPLSAPPMTPAPPTTPYGDRGAARLFPSQVQTPQPSSPPQTPRPVYNSQPPSAPDYRQPSAPVGQAQSFALPAASVARATIARPRVNPRTLLYAIVAFVVIVLIAGGAWILLSDPFSVPAATQPTQTVTNTTLGVTLTDPAGWQQKSTGSTWSLQDSSGTAQMVLAQTAAPASSDLTNSLNKQAHALGMSNGKVGAPITFAGTSWSQIHGDYQNQGANYTGTIYATVHNGHLYTLTQLAPRVTFNDEERLVFAASRTSLQWH